MKRFKKNISSYILFQDIVDVKYYTIVLPSSGIREVPAIKQSSWKSHLYRTVPRTWACECESYAQPDTFLFLFDLYIS